jgi:NADPH-dependent glutamate synthase beta subunit-like oxidoreductase
LSANTPRHVVAVVGGAVSGAEAVETLVSRGIHVVVLEQNDRPYGKIEDGLPKWHDKQRRQEYARIDGKLDRPEVSFVPRTAIGRDVDFGDLVRDWGFSAVLLANGSWRDRSSGVAGSDEMLGKGFLYQNPFIYWFNHNEEKTYSGPRYEAADGAVVLGGGLASIDVVKVLMLETAAKALRARGIECDVVEMEHESLAGFLKAKGVTLADLGVKGCTLVYRRSVGEMPVASTRDDSAAEKERAAKVRERLISLSTEKFLFRMRPHSVARKLVVDNGRVVGISLARTEYRNGKLVTVEGSDETLPTPLVISSIGSIPMPVPGIPMDGEFYKYEDWNVGRLAGFEGVYALGNVVTGKGNIAVSRRHGKQIADHVIASYLGVAEGNGKVDALAAAAAAAGERVRVEAGKVADHVKAKPSLAPEAVERIRGRVADRWKSLGYPGYRDWIRKVTPPDMR